MTGGQAVVKSLKAEKVEHMFGLIGSATIEVFDTLYEEKKIKFIGVRDEKTGTHMADGYARASGKPAIVDIAADPKALYSFRRDSFKHRKK